ncbi:hypothetical protein EVAR_7754_1 [Eumeta japonica]|uniref:Uncharacterized protein n=1 Tax=Eumeta variegata TaxID=151549 RepID=A0A4C1TMB9_EUMVA|nr:hypothetical protein EVAR_7754_1 [Eumeta japonica]
MIGAARDLVLFFKWRRNYDEGTPVHIPLKHQKLDTGLESVAETVPQVKKTRITETRVITTTWLVRTLAMLLRVRAKPPLCYSYCASGPADCRRLIPGA